MRSIWKGFFFNDNFVDNLNNVILFNIIDKNLSLYNGKRKFDILIKSNMLFLKIGSLVFTRKINVKHKKKENKILKKKKK